MGLLDHLSKLSGQTIIGRWGTGTVTEAYEGDFGPYTVTLFRNAKFDKWTASCHREAFPHTSADAYTKEEAVKALELQLKERFLEVLEEFMKEVEHISLLEAAFDREDSPKSALERLANEPI